MTYELTHRATRARLSERSEMLFLCCAGYRREESFWKSFFTLFRFCVVPILERKLLPKSGANDDDDDDGPTPDYDHNGEVTHEQQCTITDTNGLCFSRMLESGWMEDIQIYQLL